MSNLRRQTLNRLKDIDFCIPNLSIPIPNPIMPLFVFEDMMYKVARKNGYLGSKTDFTKDFVKSLTENAELMGIIVQKGSVSDFPEKGLENAIYIDTENNHIYYWKDNNYYKINNNSGGLEEGTILNGGNAGTI